MGSLSDWFCFLRCVAELMYDETGIVNDFARIVMSGGLLGLFLQCLFNPFSCLQAKSLQIIFCADGLTWISSSIFLWNTSPGQTNMHKIIPEKYNRRLPRKSTCVLCFTGFPLTSPSKESGYVIQFPHLLCEPFCVLQGKWKVTAMTLAFLDVYTS